VPLQYTAAAPFFDWNGSRRIEPESWSIISHSTAVLSMTLNTVSTLFTVLAALSRNESVRQHRSVPVDRNQLLRPPTKATSFIT
jgi:hypothetical protein